MNGLAYKYRIVRARLRRLDRMLFMSPAERKFVRVMGGFSLTLPFIKSARTGFSLTYVLTLGRILKRENMQREVRVGRYYIDFGNDIKRGIEIDGQAWHMDVLKEQERDEYCREYGWILLHIQARDLWQNPKYVRHLAIAFLQK